MDKDTLRCLEREQAKRHPDESHIRVLKDILGGDDIEIYREQQKLEQSRDFKFALAIMITLGLAIMGAAIWL